jgi:lipid II:glycine glycyltransferase (peptidoglycan interpeptide bridge formation enzyme)
MWETLKSEKIDTDKLTAHLFLAKYNEEVLASWILFVYKNILYYPYGSSSISHRETMASNLMMWEAIKFGKKLGLEKFDMWGALSNNPDKNDPWYGFHRFKEGYGPKHIEFLGSFDLVINPVLYNAYKILDKIRWVLLRIKK